MINLSFILELGDDCGLTTVGEAFYNVRIRLGQFGTEEQPNFIKAVQDSEKVGMKRDDLIEDWLPHISAASRQANHY